MKCRHCATPLDRIVIDLGVMPPSNAYVSEEARHQPEKSFPLKAFVCESCWLVQLQDFTGAEELFRPDYAYFSSVSKSWLRHSEAYVDAMVERFSLNSKSQLVEIAANDGYLLQYANARGIACYGIEPTATAAAIARAKGLDIIEEFFGEKVGRELAAANRSADLIAANNVLAHVPDINDFLLGFRELLKPHGVATFEFPHLLNLMTHAQFDTIYHEHYSYLSLVALERIFTANGLVMFDVEELPTHGGSLRCYVQRADAGNQPRVSSVDALLMKERAAGVDSTAYYDGLQAKADRIRDDFVAYLLDAKRNGLSVAAYGAAAKGNTLINYAAVGADLISFVVDNNPSKQGCYLPGSRIPIVAESVLREKQPDRVVILPWNIAGEITNDLAFISEWGGRCVRFVPHLEEFAPSD